MNKSRGKISVTNDIVEIKILPSQIEDYLDQGWSKGRLRSSTLAMSKSPKGKIWIHIESNGKRVYPRELDAFLEQGWILGQTEEHRKSNGKGNEGKIWIHKDLKEKPIRENELESFMEEGWSMGKTKEHCLNDSKAQKKLFENGYRGSNFNKHSLKNKTYEQQMGYEKAREVKRIRRIKRIEQMGENFNKYVAFNKISVEFFKKFDELFDTVGKFSMKDGSGEYNLIGYYLDYYNDNLKLIIEWDEEYHFDNLGNLRKRDIERQKEIQDYLPDFKFIRIREKDFLLQKKPKIVDYDKCLECIINNL